MPRVRPVCAEAPTSLIEAPTATCYLCGAPWQDGDALVLVHTHTHTVGTSLSGAPIPEVDVALEFAHEGCAQQRVDYAPLPGSGVTDRMAYGPTWESCCGPAMTVSTDDDFTQPGRVGTVGPT